jgi:hypothetical protein
MGVSYPRAADRPSTIGIVRSGITLGMAIAGAVVIDLWNEGDPETRAMASDETGLACLVFAAMRREECKSRRKAPAPHDSISLSPDPVG